MTLLKLFFEFFKIGTFAIGGGMATIPFLQELSERTGWFEPALITDMIAISESTPGPIGINMATYIGYNIVGVLGGVIATVGVILPSIIIITLVSKSLERFSSSKYVDYIFYGLRPAVTGLIAAAGFQVFKLSILNMDKYLGTKNIMDLIIWKKIVFFLLIFYLIKKYKKHPVLYIGVSAIIGIIFKF